MHTEPSVQYVDHNLLQTDEKNPDDHLFLRSAAQRFGLWLSNPATGCPTRYTRRTSAVPA